MRIMILLSSLLLSAAVQAALYKWVDENGEVVYSDQPPHEGAEPLEPPPIVTTPPVKVKPKPAAAKKQPESEKKPAPINYSEFSITTPGNDEAVRNNPGNVEVSFSLQPALATDRGHHIVLLVDGKASDGKILGQSVTVPHMDRGTHTLKAEIRDETGKTLKSSNTVTFHLLRYSKLFKKPTPPPANPSAP